ncbi:MAG: choice-of-anchor J domain-containing protein, partial [Paludibacteraceae bacterium]|nr:choice-of-anchor J domain-containing protein [Paludibacteraceae bacterium]
MRTTTAKLLRSVWMLCFACCAFIASAQYTILDTGFEEGLPTGWVVEKGIADATWTHDATDTGNELPAKAYEGMANMLFFQDGVSTMATSRLITPKLDLSKFNVIGVGTPLLTFHYANTGRIFESHSFVDTLRIYGRAQETDEWTLLKTIDSSQDRWTKDTVDLNFYASNTAYQICFEAANGNGRGVMIDEVKVIATAFCSAVPTIRITEKTETTAKISWYGSQDVRTSELKVSTTPLTDMSQKGDIYDGILTIREYQLTGLTLQQNYYVYVRNYCDYNDYSPWASTAFRPDIAVNVPYTMDFEDYPNAVNNEYTDKPGVDTLNLPENWTYWKNAHLLKTLSTDYQHYPYRGWGKTASFNPDNVAKENRFLNIKAYNKAENGSIEPYVILPRLSVDSIQKLQVTFAYKTPTYTYSKLRVGVVDDPADEGSFTLIEELSSLKSNASTGQWITVTVSFANYKGQGKYIAFQQEAVRYQNKEGGTNTSTFLDDIKVEYMPECAKATALQTSQETSTSALLTWAGNATSYDLKVSSTRMEDMTAMADIFNGTLTENTKQITGLKPGTSYRWYVKPTCGTEWSSWTINTIVTDKDTMSIPYKQDFNSYFYGTASNLPNGWTFLGGYSTVPYLNTTNYSAPASMYVGGSTSASSYAVTPCMKAPVNKLQATFMCYTTNVTYKMQVGVMTDPADQTTFVPMDTVEFEAKNEWQETTVEFANYTGAGCYIAFKVGELTGGPVYIDDLTISIIPSCKMVDVIDLTDFTSNSVQVNWAPRGEETEWTLYYGPAGFDLNKAGTKVTVTGKPSYKITGLEEATEYDIYVRAECGEEGYGPWRMTTALTQFSPAKLKGYKHDFSAEKENSKWVFVNGTNTNQWVIGNNCPVEKENPAAYVSNQPDQKTFEYTLTSGNKNAWMYRTFEAIPGTYTMSFNWKGYGYSSYAFVRAFLVPADVELEENDFNKKYGTITTAIPQGWINLAVRRTTSSELLYLNQDSIWENGWSTSEVDFAIKEAGRYNIAFMWMDNSNSGSTVPVAIDNIAIDTTSSPAPQCVNVDVNYIPATKVKFTWEGGIKTEIKVVNKDITTVAKRHLFDHLQSTDTLVAWGKDISTWEYLAEGLSVGTKYYYALRTYNENDTSDWVVGNFTTILAVGTPYNDNFNAIASASTPPIPWKKIGASAKQVMNVAPTMELLFEGAAKGTGTEGWKNLQKLGNTSYSGCSSFTQNAFMRSCASSAKGTYGGIRYYMYSPCFIVKNEDLLRFDVVYTNTKTTSDVCNVDATALIDSTDLFAVLISTDMGATRKMK